jgi:hypothetical protein
MRVRMIAFYIVGLSTKTLRNTLFVDSTNSIIEKTAVMMIIVTEENACLKRYFGRDRDAQQSRDGQLYRSCKAISTGRKPT